MNLSISRYFIIAQIFILKELELYDIHYQPLHQEIKQTSENAVKTREKIKKVFYSFTKKLNSC